MHTLLTGRPRRTIWPVVWVLMLLLAMPGAALAQEPASPPAPVGVHDVDDGALEIGVEYVVDYQNCGGWGLGDLPATAPDANGLRDRLTATYWFAPFFSFPTPRWQSNWTYGNTLAWESDWTSSEEFYIDSVDFAYFAGHGASSGILFGVGGNTRRDCQATKADTAGRWGTRDNDWIGLAACNVLDNPFSNYQGWASSMNGTRLLMGFQTVMSDVPFGDAVGWRLRWGNNFTQSWFGAVDALLPSSQVARILAEDGAHFNDTWANHNTPTVVDSTFFWWTHQSTGAVGAAEADATRTVDGANKIDVGILGGEMPVFLVQPLSLEAAEGQYSQIANAFGLTSTTPITSVSAADVLGTGDVPVFTSDDGSLIMDQKAGNYLYIDPNRLWNEQAVQQQILAADAQAVRAISGDDAIIIANDFLTNTGLSLADASQPTVVADVISGGTDPTRFTGASAAEAEAAFQAFDDVVTNYKVKYDRILTYEPPVTSSLAAAGVNAINFSVVGAGAKLTVYVAPTVAVTASAASPAGQSSVMGGQGGWRQLQPAINAASGQQVMATMLSTSTIETLFNKIEEKVALDFVPLATEEKEITNITAGYYEGPIGMQLAQLIPIYILTVQGTLQDSSTQTYDVFIPVNEGDMAPYAEILTPTVGILQQSLKVNVTAADASKTLAQLGVDPSLNFVLGSGTDYEYSWYVNDASGTPLLTSVTPTASLTIPAEAIQASDGDKLASVKLILQVRDLGKTSDPKVASDEIVLNFNPSFLPIIDQ